MIFSKAMMMPVMKLKKSLMSILILKICFPLDH
nr:MAG TPA: hypothetical protein [Caudoviricetes sp.]